MTTIAISNLEMVEEEAVTDDDMKELYGTIKKGMQLPFVPNLFKAAANSENAVNGTWHLFDNVFAKSSLPVALKAMILYSIAAANKCNYCSVVHQMTCKTIGVDEETIKNLTENLEALEPRRVQAIINFAMKVAHHAQELVEEDYDNVRDQGVSDEELTEIITLAALGNYLDTLADAFKIDLDSAIKQAIGS